MLIKEQHCLRLFDIMLMFVKFHSQKNVRPTQGQICQNRLKILLLRLRNLLNELMLCRCRRTLPKIFLRHYSDIILLLYPVVCWFIEAVKKDKHKGSLCLPVKAIMRFKRWNKIEIVRERSPNYDNWKGQVSKLWE